MKKFVLIPFDEIDKYNTKQEKTMKRLNTENILISIPKNVKHKARAILDHIIEGDVITWNEKGEISIEGNRIENSHITDLIKCSLYSYKNLDPKGYNQFHLALQKSNIPQSLIQQSGGSIPRMQQNLPPPGIPVKHQSKRSVKQTAIKEWVWHPI